MPTVTFDTSSRHIALTKNDARIFDTRGWKSTLLPGVRRIHDFNAGGVVAATTSSALVFDLRGKKRMSLPLRESDADTYRLRPDGRRLVFIRDPEASLATYDTETGRLLADVSPTFPGEGEGLDAGLGWSEQGAFLVRAYLSHRVYNLDLSTGKLWRHTKKH